VQEPTIFLHLFVSRYHSLDTHQFVFTYRYSSDCSNDMLPSYSYFFMESGRSKLKCLTNTINQTRVVHDSVCLKLIDYCLE